MDFFEWLTLHLDDMKQDLQGLPLIHSDAKVGDFGCGGAYTTLVLMLAVNANQCTGVDIFMGKEGSPSIEKAQNNLETVRASVLESPEISRAIPIIQDIRHLLRKGRWPILQPNDVVNGRDFLDNLDLAYCKNLLKNICSGLYNNSPKGEEGVTIAIRNMAGCVKKNGLICIVEPKDIWPDFEKILKQTGLTFLDKHSFSRNDIGLSGRIINPVKGLPGHDTGLLHMVAYYAMK